MTLKFGLDFPINGDYADPRLLAELAYEAEAAGWDGVFLYDQVATDEPEPLIDPWLALMAMALRTSRVRLGTLVTPLARRRPWKVARETGTLDAVSGGRLVLGVGLGSGETEFDHLGEEPDAKRRAEILDESLAVLQGLWSGAPFKFEGRHHKVQTAGFLPRPVQQPRIPVWVAGIWPNQAPIRRAARWDGVFPHFRGGMITPEALRGVVALVRAGRADGSPFEVIIRNKAAGQDAAARAESIRALAAEGLTWWLEGVETSPTLELMRARIRQGPPRA